MKHTEGYDPSTLGPQDHAINHLKYRTALPDNRDSSSTVAARATPSPKLSARECECLTWVAKGKSSWDIGQILGVSENTVNYHLKNILQKLGTSSRTVAAIRAMKLQLIEV